MQVLCWEERSRWSKPRFVSSSSLLLLLGRFLSVFPFHLLSLSLYLNFLPLFSPLFSSPPIYLFYSVLCSLTISISPAIAKPYLLLPGFLLLPWVRLDFFSYPLFVFPHRSFIDLHHPARCSWFCKIRFWFPCGLFRLWFNCVV